MCLKVKAYPHTLFSRFPPGPSSGTKCPERHVGTDLGVQSGMLLKDNRTHWDGKHVPTFVTSKINFLTEKLVKEIISLRCFLHIFICILWENNLVAHTCNIGNKNFSPKKTLGLQWNPNGHQGSENMPLECTAFHKKMSKLFFYHCIGLHIHM